MVFEYKNTGNRHIKNNSSCEDYTSHLENDKYFCIVLADGVSSCKHSGMGAIVAANSLLDILFYKADYFFDFDVDTIKDYVLSHVVYELKKYAETHEGEFTDYSSTLAAVLYDKTHEKYISLNLGDGIIMATGFGSIDVVSQPADSISGCPVTTNDEVKSFTEIKMGSGNFEMFILMSDGSWHELYERNKITKDASDILQNCDHKALIKYLDGKRPEDDYSFIMAKIY